MARTFGAAQYLSKATALFTAPQFSFAAWVNITSFATSPTPFIISDAAGSNYFAASTDTTGHPRASLAQTGTFVAAVSTATLTLNTWGHICAVYFSPTSRTIYCNGGGANSNGTSSAPVTTGINTTYVGGDPASPFGDNLSGQLAWAAFWNTALTAADAAALAAGAHPFLVQPSKLVSCLNLTGGNSPEPDLILPTGWTITSTPAQSANPRIYQ